MLAPKGVPRDIRKDRVFETRRKEQRRRAVPGGRGRCPPDRPLKRRTGRGFKGFFFLSSRVGVVCGYRRWEVGGGVGGGGGRLEFGGGGNRRRWS